MSSVVFVHLSDIHFRYKRSGTSYDLDTFVRDEIERSLDHYTKGFSRVDLILVSGDVAFAGKSEEYNIAETWLTKVATQISCPPKNILTIPGNHDVDRTIHVNNKYILGIHGQIRKHKAQVDEKIRANMQDGVRGKVLFAPLEAYQSFASRYGCFTGPEQLYWDWPIDVGGGYKIRIRGLNSAFICSAADGNTPRNQLAVGEMQSSVRREDGVFTVLMCHHPSRWLVDQENFDLCTLAPGIAPLQLFGHEHEFQVQKCDNALRLYAGAVHPSRDESFWCPRYNIIEVDIAIDAAIPSFSVNVWALKWHHSNRRFELDPEHCPTGSPYTWRCPIDEPLKPLIAADASVEKQEERPSLETVTSTDSELSSNRAAGLDATRSLVNAFISLHYHQIAEISTNLGLVEDEDEGLSNNQRYRRYYERIKERPGGLYNLWDAVSRHESSRLDPNLNPFPREA